jgi:hypothetical protein
MTANAQLFCTVSDLISDNQSLGVDETRLFQAIREACDYLQKEIGWFIPVTLTRNYNGRGYPRLFVDPLLTITSIVNDGTTLAGTDYIAQPEHRFWANGPYGQIIIDPDAANLSAWVDEDDGIQIAGRWGLYQRTASLTATVADTTEQSISQTTLKVSDGSQVSPGMPILIGSEQELVTGWGSPTTSVTTLNGAVTATEDTITVANGTLVNVGEVCRFGFEQFKVRDKQTHELYVWRGWNGTARESHLTAVAVDVYRTVNVERGVNGTTAAVHANGASISRYVAPEDVQYLAKQIATLIVNKARSGYQGRTGNPEQGLVFYNDAFPRFDIERIKSRYMIKRFP